MIGCGRGGGRLLAGWCATLAVVALAAGCDWLKGSDMIRRTSPFISNLGVDPASASCQDEVKVSFDYDDPQGDIFSVSLILEHDGDNRTRDFSTVWNDEFSRSSGSAEYFFQFACGDPRGHWTITLTIEDEVAHTSNTLTGGVTLE